MNRHLEGVLGRHLEAIDGACFSVIAKGALGNKWRLNNCYYIMMASEDLLKNPSECISYRGYLFILRIAEEGQKYVHINKEIILEHLSVALKEMQLNEIEISVLSIYLERFGWECKDPLESVIIFTAYTAKCLLNENTTHIESFLSRKYSFFVDYKKWISNYRSSVLVDYIAMNNKYSYLSKADITAEEIDSFNYTQAVSQLIETSTRPERLDS